ncbi:MAG: hypothetical protein AAF871_13090 [Pseudomonadota bacterium]
MTARQPKLFVTLSAIADTLAVYPGDAAKFLKCCNISHIPAERVLHDNATGSTLKAWHVDPIIDLLKRAVTGFDDDQEDYLRSRARRSWRDVKRGVPA